MTDTRPPATAPAQGEGQPPDAASAARALWAGRFHGVLSTGSVAHPGYPFGSLVPYCLDETGCALLLLSHLAQHRRNLDTDPRCALTVSAGDDGADDIQQRPRISVLADASPDPNPAHLERYCRYYPDGRAYAEALNFHLYRLEPVRAHYNGGFATARWLGRERLLWAAPLAPAPEAGMLANLNDGGGALGVVAGALADNAQSAGITAVGLDAEGLDLRVGGRLQRLPAGAAPVLDDLFRAAGLRR